jgi:hypothetical protein
MLIIQNISIKDKVLIVGASSREIISSKADFVSAQPEPILVLQLDFGNGDPLTSMGITKELVEKLDTPCQVFLGIAQNTWSDLPVTINELNVMISELVVNDDKVVFNKYTGILAEANPFHKYRVATPEFISEPN